MRIKEDNTVEKYLREVFTKSQSESNKNWRLFSGLFVEGFPIDVTHSQGNNSSKWCYHIKDETDTQSLTDSKRLCHYLADYFGFPRGSKITINAYSYHWDKRIKFGIGKKPR